MKNEMQNKEENNTREEALKKYLNQFKTAKQVITEMHHLNTYQYHLNIKLWHITEDAQTNEEDVQHLKKVEDAETQDNTLLVAEDSDSKKGFLQGKVTKEKA